jgi:hypothetical protein
MMAAGRPQGPNDPSLISSLETAVRRVRRPGPIGLAWNWRVELALVAAIAGLCLLIANSIGLIGLAVAAGAGLAAGTALLYWPPARARIIARAWCVITPHRILTGCVNAWVQTRSGRLPIIWSVAPADFGERVRLWCPAGITAADLIAARELLAAACWAMEVRVIPDLRHTHLVTLEVIRHSHAERTGPTPHDWPYSPHVADDGLGDGLGEGTEDADDQDPVRWQHPPGRRRHDR